MIVISFTLLKQIQKYCTLGYFVAVYQRCSLDMNVTELSRDPAQVLPPPLDRPIGSLEPHPPQPGTDNRPVNLGKETKSIF